MNAQEEAQVVVKRDWFDDRTAAVPRSAISGLHFATWSGGTNSSLPRPTLAGYISCYYVRDVEFGRSCRHGRPPHSIKVLIFRTHNDMRVYRELCSEASSN